jgi:hypothetical protein
VTSAQFPTVRPDFLFRANFTRLQVEPEARKLETGSKGMILTGGIQMRRMRHVLAAMAFAALGSLVAFAQAPQQPAGGAPAGQGRAGGRGGPQGPASFFITSVGKGDGANYGGLAGADAYCAQMAQAGGIATPPGRTWRAYLSQPASGGQPAVNAATA